MNFKKSIVEESVLRWFGELGYEIRHGSNLAPAGPAAGRNSSGGVVLVGRSREAVGRVNPSLLICFHA